MKQLSRIKISLFIFYYLLFALHEAQHWTKLYEQETINFKELEPIAVKF
jgi:hypothetical protein